VSDNLVGSLPFSAQQPITFTNVPLANGTQALIGALIGHHTLIG